MRIPYAPEEPPTSSTASADENRQVEEIYTRIAARRHPRPLISLDLALLHSPLVADGYNSFVGALRTKTIVSPALLELAICRIAVLNDAVYEWNIHGPLALKAGLKASVLQYARTVSVEELTRVATGVIAGTLTSSDSDDVLAKSGAGKEELVVLLYTDEMTKNVKVHDTTFDAVKSAFYRTTTATTTATTTTATATATEEDIEEKEKEIGNRQIVELTTAIAGYNAVSRLLVSLDIGENNGREMKSVEEMESSLG